MTERGADFDAKREAAVTAMEAVDAALKNFNGGPESAMDFVVSIARISGAYSVESIG